MRTEALYNNKILYLADYFTSKNGMQIAIENQIEKLRDYGKKGQLLCTCGCGGLLTLVAGKKMKRRQHFRLQKEQNMLCRAYEESPITINAKFVLKCWLDDVFRLQMGEVKFNIPLNQIGDNTRRYEYTLYVLSKKLGIYYEKNESNLYDEKIGVLSDENEVTTICITDISNVGCVGQYPEFGIKAQKIQGFSAFLSADAMIPYEEAILKIVRYEKSYEGLWTQLDICEDKLSEYSFNLDNKLCISGHEIEKLAIEKSNEYIEEQAELKAFKEKQKEEEQKKLEIMHQKEETRKREEDEKKERERIAAEKRKNELQQKKEEIIKKINLLNLHLNKCKVIAGNFKYVFMKDNTLKQGYEKINVRTVNYNWTRNRFEITDTTGKKRYIFLQLDSEIQVDTSYTWDGYSVFPIYDVDINNLISVFQDKYGFADEECEKIYICTLEHSCPNKDKQSNLCKDITDDNKCGYRRYKKSK